MDNDTRDYRKGELDHVLKGAYEDFKPQIQINWTGFRTKWLSITETELRQIINILTK